MIKPRWCLDNLVAYASSTLETIKVTGAPVSQARGRCKSKWWLKNERTDWAKGPIYIARRQNLKNRRKNSEFYDYIYKVAFHSFHFTGSVLFSSDGSRLQTSGPDQWWSSSIREIGFRYSSARTSIAKATDHQFSSAGFRVRRLHSRTIFRLSPLTESLEQANTYFGLIIVTTWSIWAPL